MTTRRYRNTICSHLLWQEYKNGVYIYIYIYTPACSKLLELSQIQWYLLINLVSLTCFFKPKPLYNLREILCMFQCKNSYKKTCRNEMFFYKITSTVYNYACSDWPILVFGSEYPNTDISRHSVFLKITTVVKTENHYVYTLRIYILL